VSSLFLFLALATSHIYSLSLHDALPISLGILMFGFFSYVFFYQLRQVPPSTGAPRVGQKAPDFTLLDQNDKPVSLADLLSAPASSASTGRANAVLVIFYRGFW